MTISDGTPRITDGFCYGTGDGGYSLLMDKTRLRKDAPAANIYGHVEILANAIDELAEYESDILNPYLLQALIWLRENSYSISSFCYMKGDTTDHVFPTSFLEYMDKRIALLDELIGDAPDFITKNRGYLRVLDKVRIHIRDVERDYVTWRYDERVVEKVASLVEENVERAQELANNIELMGAILNRASAWVFWELRYEKHLLKQQSTYEISSRGLESYWVGKVIPFAM